MLRHDDSSETDIPAALVRVTPQELAAALARLEARQGGLDGTIPLGDAVQELGLNVTPDELLREIEAGRARQHEGQPQTRQARLLRVVLGSLVGGLLLLGGVFTLRLAAPVPSTPAAAMTTSAAPQAAPIGVPDTLLVQRPDHKMVLLSEVPDGQPVHCGLTGTETGAAVARFADFAPASYHWTLIKYGQQVYVRGWIGDMSDTALRSTVVEVHPIFDWVTAGMRPVRVTLPLGGFRLPSGLSDDSLINASHIVPDAHFKEKW